MLATPNNLYMCVYIISCKTLRPVINIRLTARAISDGWHLCGLNSNSGRSLHTRQTRQRKPLERGVGVGGLLPLSPPLVATILPSWLKACQQCSGYQRQLQLFLIIHFHFCARSAWNPKPTLQTLAHTHTQKTLNRISVFSPSNRQLATGNKRQHQKYESVYIYTYIEPRLGGCFQSKLWAWDLDWNWDSARVCA